jgi:hypothetical protein
VNELIWLLIVLFILLFLFILIIFTKLTIIVNYFHHNDDDDLKLEFRIWFGLIRYKKHIPLIKIDDDSPTLVVKSKKGNDTGAKQEEELDVHQFGKNHLLANLKNTEELLHRVFKLHVIVRKFFRRVTIKQFEWHTLMGTRDAAETGVLTGAIWAIKGSIIGLISHYLRLKKMPNISVTPYFQQAIIQTRLTCMIQFRVGYAILAGLKLIKFWKGGKPHLHTSAEFSKEKTKSV